MGTIPKVFQWKHPFFYSLIETFILSGIISSKAQFVSISYAIFYLCIIYLSLLFHIHNFCFFYQFLNLFQFTHSFTNFFIQYVVGWNSCFHHQDHLNFVVKHLFILIVNGWLLISYDRVSVLNPFMTEAVII